MRHEPGFIIIDTEGTGLFRHRDDDGNVVPSDAPGQPRMAEFAAVLADADFNVTTSFQSYIKPVDWDPAEMPATAQAIHGLSFEFLMDQGRPAKEALEFYLDAVLAGRAVVGWNQQHDGRQVRAELRRHGYEDYFEQTKTTCLMRSCQANLIKIKKTNGKGGYARLIDAAAHFGIPYDEARRHSALEDAAVTAHVGGKIYGLGALLEPAVHYASGYKGEKDS